MNRTDQIACDRPLGVTLAAGALCARGSGHTLRPAAGLMPVVGFFHFKGREMGEPITFNLDKEGFEGLLQYLTSKTHRPELMLEVHKDGLFVMAYNVTDISMTEILDFYNRWSPEGYEISIKAENHH
jgi:hypothetical protein